MVNDCTTQTLFHVMSYQDKSYARLSKRFHFAVSKMIDGSNGYGGVDNTAAHRAFKGWVPCSEWRFRSNRKLSEMEYGNWKLIPRRAWKNSRWRTILRGFEEITFFKKNPQKAYVFKTVELKGKKYTLLVQSGSGTVYIDGSDLSVTFALYDGYLLVAWMEVSVYWSRLVTRICDLYVKEEYRHQGLGTKLIQTLAAWTKMQEIPPGPFTIMAFIPIVDVYTPERKAAAIGFLRKNGFSVSLADTAPSGLGSCSKILAAGTITKT